MAAWQVNTENCGVAGEYSNSGMVLFIKQVNSLGIVKSSQEVKNCEHFPKPTDIQNYITITFHGDVL